MSEETKPEKTHYQGKTRKYSIKAQKLAHEKYIKSNKEAGKIRFEITAVESKVKDTFTALRDIVDKSGAELLKGMLIYCDNPQFKRFMIDGEYLENKEDFFII